MFMEKKILEVKKIKLLPEYEIYFEEKYYDKCDIIDINGKEYFVDSHPIEEDGLYKFQVREVKEIPPPIKEGDKSYWIKNQLSEFYSTKFKSN